MQYDFLAIGDIVVDDFIRLKDAQVHCNINNESCEICMRWGDKIPFEFVVPIPGVGNSANAAVAAARLGLRSALRAYVGQDDLGAQCLEALRKDNVSTEFVEQEAGKATNHHYVLWFEDNRTILVKHETYDYAVPRMAEPPKWIYLSSLGDNSLPYHLALMEQCKQWPETKLAFQPGTFQMQLGTDALKGVYERTDIFFCNKEEAQRILKSESQDIKELLAGLRALGPKVAVITDDRRGAFASDGANSWSVPLYPQPPAYEKTGAGDAFASSVTAALVAGLPLEQALLWGPVNAMSVVSQIGAQKGLLTRAQLDEYLAKAPPEFALAKI